MIKNIRRLEPTESQIQMAIVEWANNVKFNDYYKIGDLLIKIPNEGKRSWFLGKKMKKEGLKKGVSDLFLAIPSHKFKISTGTSCDRKISGGLWLEVKSKSGKFNDSQIEWYTKMMIFGYEAICVHTVDSGIQAIKDYLGMR